MNKQMRAIEKKMSFCAAHILDLEEDHPCSRFHGHNLELTIRIESEGLNENGFIVDFNDLKEFKTEVIDKLLDHSTIVTKKFYKQIKDLDHIFGKVYVLPVKYKNTTVELLSEHITHLLISFFKTIDFHDYSKLTIRLSETNNNIGEYTMFFGENKDEESISEGRKGDVLKHFEKIKNKMKEQYDSNNTILEDRIDNIYEQIGEIENKFNDLIELADTSVNRLDEIDERLESLDGELEEKFDEIDEKLDHLKNVCDELEEETDNNNSDLNQLKDDVLNIDNAFNDLEGRVEDIENLLEME